MPDSVIPMAAAAVRMIISRRFIFWAIRGLPKVCRLRLAGASGICFTLTMRLWTLHPKYLDAKGLVALWREALLAQKVLRGKTKGYRHHPQLARFKAHENPVVALAAYLREVHKEAKRRGYAFDGSKI